MTRSGALTSAEDITALVAEHPEWWGALGPAGADLRTRMLGRGESYVAWLVELGPDPRSRHGLVVRVPHRSDALPRPMREEFAALRLAPSGLGPAPVALQDSAEPDAPAYMVVDHVPGRVLGAAEWTDEVIAAHARQLARLHARPYAGHGALTAPPDERSRRMSILEPAEASMDWWRGQQDAPLDPEVERLWPGVRRLLREAEPAFSVLDRFAHVHGDACVVNVLVDGATPRYVDWEWSAVGDPARDLAYLGGEIWAEPWYLPLEPPRVRGFLEEYVTATAGLTGTAPDLEALELRRQAWLVFETFFVTLHFRRQPDGARYRTAIARLTDGLRALTRAG